MSKARVPYGQIKLDEGRLVDLYEPDQNLWVCLIKLKNRPPAQSPTPREVLEATIAHCVAVNPREFSDVDLVRLSRTVLKSWDAFLASEPFVGPLREYVRVFLERHSEVVVASVKLIALARNPPPEVYENYAKVVQREARAQLPKPTTPLGVALLD
jgi:hypothetical protein